ncbi:MAG: hypothetical protein QNJ20_07555 [Paracoccaceae bacterium]|nr:hypothetical protein [Paracoccaceae bacterium]
MNRKNALVSFDVPTPVRLSLLWATLMSLYVYNDFFSLYLPGEVEALSAGNWDLLARQRLRS